MQRFFSHNRNFLASAFVLASVVAITYHPSLALNFYADDYSFVEQAGRSSLVQYLAFYFDPRAQTGWYRPMQGMLFGLEWLVFGGIPLGYHLLNALVHLGNTLLVFAIVSRLTRSPRTAFLTALIWLGLPLYGVAVFWPGDADFLLTLFYLVSIYFWILFLQQQTKRWQIFSFAAFLLALFTKEFGVTIPVTLFLLDRFILRDNIRPRALLARYAPYLVVYAIYLPLELYIQSRSVLTNEFGYGLGAQIPQNFINYLTALAFPWLLPHPLDYLWLIIVLIALISLSMAQRNLTPIILLLVAIVAFIPVTPFPWFFHRYLYSAVIVSAMIFSWLVNAALKKFRPRWGVLAASAALATIVLGNGLGVAAATADFAEIGRQTRVPFRDFTQRHSAILPDTLIYFIDPPTIPSQLSGMFFLRYGAGVRVASDDQVTRANLREHQAAFVIYFDEQKRTQEIAVEKNISAQASSPMPPWLLSWELASAHAKRGGAIALILYWAAPIGGELKLVDALTGQALAVSSGRTRGAAADARVLAIPLDARTGLYRVEIMAVDAAQKFVIEPIVVGE